MTNKNDTMVYNYFFNSGGDCKVFYNNDIFYIEFSGNVTHAYKEWFSRMLLKMNNFLKNGYSYKEIELRIEMNDDKSYSGYVDVNRDENKLNMFFSNTGELFYLDNKNEQYSVIHSERLVVLYSEIQAIIQNHIEKTTMRLSEDV